MFLTPVDISGCYLDGITCFLPLSTFLVVIWMELHVSYPCRHFWLLFGWNYMFLTPVDISGCYLDGGSYPLCMERTESHIRNSCNQYKINFTHK